MMLSFTKTILGTRRRSSRRLMTNSVLFMYLLTGALHYVCGLPRPSRPDHRFAHQFPRWAAGRRGFGRRTSLPRLFYLCRFNAAERWRVTSDNRQAKRAAGWHHVGHATGIVPLYPISWPEHDHLALRA